jgi:hypothetical protein
MPALNALATRPGGWNFRAFNRYLRQLRIGQDRSPRVSGGGAPTTGGVMSPPQCAFFAGGTASSGSRSSPVESQGSGCLALALVLDRRGSLGDA